MFTAASKWGELNTFHDKKNNLCCLHAEKLHMYNRKNAASKAGLVTLAEKPRQLPRTSKSDPEASRYRHLDSIKNRQTVYSPFLCSG
jgi:hypothetical protein